MMTTFFFFFLILPVEGQPMTHCPRGTPSESDQSFILPLKPPCVFQIHFLQNKDHSAASLVETKERSFAAVVKFSEMLQAKHYIMSALWDSSCKASQLLQDLTKIKCTTVHCCQRNLKYSNPVISLPCSPLLLSGISVVENTQHFLLFLRSVEKAKKLPCHFRRLTGHDS